MATYRWSRGRGRAGALAGASLLFLALALSLLRVPAHAATTHIIVTGTGDADFPAVVCGTLANCPTLRDAVATANGMTSTAGNPIEIDLPSGTVTLIHTNMTLGSATNLFVTIKGATSNATNSVIRQTLTSGAAGVFVTALVDNLTTNFQDLTIEGGNMNGFGGGAFEGGDPGTSATFTNCILQNNTATTGGAIVMSPGGDVTIVNSTLSGNSSTSNVGGAVDFNITGITNGITNSGTLTITNSTFTNNTVTTIPNGATEGGAIAAIGIHASLVVTGSTFSGNVAGSAGGGSGAGGAVFSDAETAASIRTSTFLDNSAVQGAAGNTAFGNGEGGAVWHNIDPSPMLLNDNRFIGNTAAAGPAVFQSTSGGSIDATANWWGSNAGPGSAIGIGSGGTVTSSPWLELRNVPTSATLAPGGATTLTADIRLRSDATVEPAANLVGLAPFTATFGNAVHGVLSGASAQYVNGVATATFTGSGTLLGPASADATADSQTVTANMAIKADTTTGVTSTVNPSVFGQGVQFRATITSNTPGTTPASPQGGTVQFKDGVANLGSAVAVSNGVATSPAVANLSVGTHTITAVYSGDGDFNGSTGNLDTNPQVVNKADTAVAVGSSLNPSVVSQNVQFTATITAVAPGAGTPTGLVQFQDNGVDIGATQTVNGSGVATFSTSALAVGTHAITANYLGDANFNASTGILAGGQVVNKAPTTTGVTSNHNPSVFGQGVDFTATVTSTFAGTITGNVQFVIDGTPAGSPIALASGSATLSGVANLTPGNHSVTADFSGDGTFAASSGGLPGGQTVNQAATSGVVTTAPNPSNAGQGVDFTVTVTATAPGAGTPAGNAQFFADGATVGSPVALTSGVATLANVTSLSIGTHAVTATYLGNADFAASTTPPVSQVVNGFPTTTTVTSSVNPSAVGQPVTFTASVDTGGNGTAGGSVQFGIDGANAGAPITLSGGSATTPAIANLAAGTHTVTATYQGDATFLPSTGALAGGQTVNQAGTTTSLASSANPSVFGQPVTFTATIARVGPAAGTPAGSVTVFADGTAVGTGTLTGGTFTTPPIATLAVGTHDVTATFAGTADDAVSTGSLAGGQTVNPAGTTTSLASSANPSVFGQPVTFTATVAPVAPGSGTPGGTVSFFLNGTPLETDPLSGGAATTAPVANLAVGSATVTATYTGSSNFSASSAAPLNQVVNPAGTTTTVTSSANPSVFGQPVTFTAMVTPVAPGAGTPTGQVEFFADGTSFGSTPLTGGQAVSPANAALTTGSHAVTATYTGDSSFATSGGSVTQVVNKAASQVSLSAAPNPSVFGQTVTFSATLTAVAPGAGTPTGQVQFLDASSPLGAPVTLVAGVASTTDASLAAGDHAISADYLGDANFVTSTDGTTQHVNPATTSTGVTSSADPSAFGQGVSFTATVLPTAPGAGTPTGQVQFFVDGATFGGPVTLAGGTGTSGVTASLAVGTHPVTATYTGDADFAASTSAPLTQVVGQVDAGATLVGTPNPSVSGQSVTLTATVTGSQGTPTGTVQFNVDGVDAGSPVTLAGGVATLTTSSLAVGDHAVTATYSGNVVYRATSATTTQSVLQAASATGLSSSVNPSQAGQAVTFTATVTAVAPGAGTPTGQVQFGIDGANAGGPVTLAAGSAVSGAITSLSVGSHSVTATYLGDTNFTASTGTLAGGQSVVQAGTATAVSSSHNPSQFGQGVTFTVTVTAVAPGAGTPTGQVQFGIDGANAGGPVTLAAGSAVSGAITSLSVGSHSVTATYLGDTNFTASTGTLAGGQSVVQAGTATAVTSSKNPSILGDTVTFTATVSAVAPGAGTPPGTVQFMIDGANAGGPVTLTAGVATYATSTLTVGNHPVATTYSGSTSYQASPGTLAGGQTVAQPPMADLAITKVGPRNSVVGVAGPYTITVTNNGPNTATGVVMTDTLPAGASGSVKSVSQGSCVVATATITCNLGTLSPGSHATVVTLVRPNRPGTGTNVATVHGDQVDPNPANNTASVTTRVGQPGYWLFASDGGVFGFGDAGFFGSTGGMHLNRPIVALTPTPDRQGYWLLGSDGGVFAYGDAGFFGSTASMRLNGPIVAMAASADGGGYVLFAADGGVFAYGDATFSGSAATPAQRPPVVGAAVTPSGQGYWLVTADGQVLPFGDAQNFGRTVGSVPVSGIAGTATGRGYWLVNQQGLVSPFGDAGSFGSLSGPLNGPIHAITATSDGQGYWLVGDDGGVFAFGNAPFLGSMANGHLNQPVEGIAGDD